MKPFTDPFPFRVPETRSSIGEVIAEITKADLKAAEAQDLKELPGKAGEAAHKKLHKTIGKFIKSKSVSEAVVVESHTRAQLEKMTTTRLRELKTKYEGLVLKGDRDAARELATIRGLLRSKGAGSTLDEGAAKVVQARLAARGEKRGGGAAQDKAADAVKVRLGKQQNKKPVTEAHDDMTGYYDGARGGGGPPAKRSKANSPKGNSTFGVPSYKATDFSAMNKKTADVLVKELERIAKYLDDQYDMAPTARTSIKELVKALKSKS